MTSAAALSPLAGGRERMWPVVIVSAILHVLAFTAAVIERPPPTIDLNQKPIAAKLVRLGEKKPQHYLPRKEAMAEPAPAEIAPVAAPAPAPKPAPAPPAAKMTAPAPRPKPKPAPAAAAGRGDVLASVLSKVKREKAFSGPVYGDPKGDAQGDASDASEGDAYLGLVERTLRETYILPATISERDRMYLRATVLLFIDPDGRVTRYEFERRSGNGAFDSALERAIRAARLPPPPTALRDRYRSEGLGVVYRP